MSSIASRLKGLPEKISARSSMSVEGVGVATAKLRDFVMSRISDTEGVGIAT